MRDDFQGGSRSSYRAKRKKTNYILNGLIVIVLLLIAFVAYSIFFSGNDNASPQKQVQNTVQKQSSQKEKKSAQAAVDNNQSDKSQVDNNQADNSQADNSQLDNSRPDNNSPADNQQQVQDSQSGDTVTLPNESKTAASVGNSLQNSKPSKKNSAGKSAGTSQTGQHTPDYNSNSKDWQEQLNAISSATGLDQKNMTVWFLGSDKSTTNGSVGTVSSKDSKQKYRVHIKWVDGKGWTPSKVEQVN